MEVSYAMAYKEVLEMIKKLPEVEYNKIPRGKIKFYENNCDYSYEFTLNSDLSNMSQKANAIMISLYKNYFTTDIQKEKLKRLLNDNSQIVEQQKREKYNPDNIFKNNTMQKEEVIEQENTQMIEYNKENLLIKLVKIIKRFFHK